MEAPLGRVTCKLEHGVTTRFLTWEARSKLCVVPESPMAADASLELNCFFFVCLSILALVELVGRGQVDRSEDLRKCEDLDLVTHISGNEHKLSTSPTRQALLVDPPMTAKWSFAVT